MSDAIGLTYWVPESPEHIYDCWLSSKLHSDFTGGEAVIDPVVGGKFSAWDGYIDGKTLELEPRRRFVQSWRTSQFPKDAPDSRLEIRVEAEKEGTRIHLTQTNIPTGQGAMYEEGWQDHYFLPLTKWLLQRS